MDPECGDCAACVHPGAEEICDNLFDDDCDGLIDREDPECGHNIAAASIGGKPSRAGGYMGFLFIPLLFAATWKGVVRRFI